MLPELWEEGQCLSSVQLPLSVYRLSTPNSYSPLSLFDWVDSHSKCSPPLLLIDECHNLPHGRVDGIGPILRVVTDKNLQTAGYKLALKPFPT